MDAAVVGGVGSRASFEKWVDPVSAPLCGPVGFVENASYEDGKWDGNDFGSGFEEA